MLPADFCTSLVRLNRLLRPVVVHMAEALHLHPGDDPFRGLHVEQQEALAALDHAPTGAISKISNSWESDSERDPLFQKLVSEFPKFTAIDFAILLLAIAVEFDPGYERVFGFLQDDVTRRRPTVALCLRLLDSMGRETNTVLSRLSELAPLRSHRLIELSDPSDGRAGPLARILRADEQFTRKSLGLISVDRRLVPAAKLTIPEMDPADLAVPDDIRKALKGELKQLPSELYLFGPDDQTKQQIAAVIAKRRGLRLLTVDASRMLRLDQPFSDTVRVMIREVLWFDNLLYLEGVDLFHTAERHQEWSELTAALVENPLPLVIAGRRPALPPTPYPLGLLTIGIPLPDVVARVSYWNDTLNRYESIKVNNDHIDQLAERYSLTRSQIEQVVASTMARRNWNALSMSESTEKVTNKSEEEKSTYELLASAARSQKSYELETLTHKIVPKVQLADLVLKSEIKEQLDDVVRRVNRRAWVLDEMGFGNRHSYGNGVNALFAGPSGTGKTMAAEAIANAIGKDMFKIDLTAVVSKYIGETEQRLEQIFQAGESAQAVLFFDEADSLLGKRSEVRDAHDRYANIEVSYLLQRMESYNGLILLATNLPGNLDDAFLRRMSDIIHFPLPSVAARRDLWSRVWPKPGILAKGDGYALDFDYLAERFELTGGGIRNTALTAAFIAADRPRYKCITMRDVLLAVRAEFQKLGQAVTDDQLGLKNYREPPEESEIKGIEGEPFVSVQIASALSDGG